MGRHRKRNKHLPQRMQLRAGTYYHVAVIDGRQRWTNLGREYGRALILWAGMEAKERPVETVADAIADYLERSRDRLAASTLEGYQKSAKRLIAVFGRMTLGDVEAHHVYRYVVERGDVSANRDRSLLSAVYTHARNHGLHKGDDPTKGMNYRNSEVARDRYITDEELGKLVAAAPGRLQQLIRMAHLTGLRQGDLLALRLSDAREDGIYLRAGKTGKALVIEWSDELRAAWRAAQGHRIGQQPLFAARGGEAYTSSGFRAVWRRVKLAAGVDVRFHDLRGKAGTEHPEPQKLLQHSDAKTTKRHYQRLPDRVKPVK
jgi:integrase